MPHRKHIPILPAGEPESAERRAFLKIMAASMALAGAGCSGPPQEVIVPYVKMPEMMVPGKPLYYATTFMHRGYAHGVLVEGDMGRPTKVEGNPNHPASLGATGVFAQASVLQLWDPDRSQTVRQGDALSTWEEFKPVVLAQRAKWDADGGAGLRILTGTITSPTLADQLAALLARYPNARWHCHDPLHDDAERLLDHRRVGPLQIEHRVDAALGEPALEATGDAPGLARRIRGEDALLMLDGVAAPVADAVEVGALLRPVIRQLRQDSARAESDRDGQADVASDNPSNRAPEGGEVRAILVDFQEALVD